MVMDHECSERLSQYSDISLWQQLDSPQLQQVGFLIFPTAAPVPRVLKKQRRIRVLRSQLPTAKTLQLVGEEFSSRVNPVEIFQGSFVTVNALGLLITGRSGAGKSQLILELLERGHQWVADELTHCYLNYTGEVRGTALQDLASFTHVKNLGPINMDEMFGLSRRLPNYPVAAVIHLKENIIRQDNDFPAYEQRSSITLLDQTFPAWHLDSGRNNLALLVETCAKQLTLEQWGRPAAEALKQKVQETLAETT